MNKQELIEKINSMVSIHERTLQKRYDDFVGSEDGYNSISDMFGHADDCFSCGMSVGGADMADQIIKFLDSIDSLS